METNGTSEELASRKRQASSNNESGSSSSSDSEDDRVGSAEHQSDGRPTHRFKKRSKQVSDLQFEFLSQQVAFLTKIITQTHTPQVHGQGNNTAPIIDTQPTSVQNNNENNLGTLILQPPSTSSVDKNLIKLSELTTTVKDPLFPKSNDSHLGKLTEIQRFKCNDWNNIRFSETQKKYVTTPGFVELSINDELRRFDTQSNDDYRNYLLERSFAAMSNAILTQKDELGNALQSLIDWSVDINTVLTPNAMFDKIGQLFNKESAYIKVTDDILQITCGRRADCINLRRESLLKQIPDDFHCGALHKIPPNAEFLFDDNLLSSYLHKIGGAEKLATSTKSSQQPQPGPSNQGRKVNDFHKPSTSRQTSEKFFRQSANNKGKFDQSKTRNTSKFNNSKNKSDRKGGKKSHSPSKYKNRRA